MEKETITHLELRTILLKYIGATPETRLALRSIPIDKDILNAIELIDCAIARGKYEAVKELATNFDFKE